MNRIASLTNETKLSAAGLVAAATGMALQIASGSTLFPTLTGPIVLIVGAALVSLRPGRWTSYLGLGIPLVLGVGLAVSAILSPIFVAQIADADSVGLAAGSVLHVIGLAAAVSGGVVMVLRPQPLEARAP